MDQYNKSKYFQTASASKIADMQNVKLIHYQKMQIPSDTPHCPQALSYLWQVGAEILENAAEIINVCGHESKDVLSDPIYQIKIGESPIGNPHSIQDIATHIDAGCECRDTLRPHTVFSAIGLAISRQSSVAPEPLDTAAIKRHSRYGESLAKDIEISIQDQAFHAVLDRWYEETCDLQERQTLDIDSAIRLLLISSEQLLKQARNAADDPELQIQTRNFDADTIKELDMLDGEQRSARITHLRKIRSFARLIRKSIEERQIRLDDPPNGGKLKTTLHRIFALSKQNKSLSIGHALQKATYATIQKHFPKNTHIAEGARDQLHHLMVAAIQADSTASLVHFTDQDKLRRYLVDFLSTVEEKAAREIRDFYHEAQLDTASTVFPLSSLQTACAQWGHHTGEGLHIRKKIDDEVMARMAKDPLSKHYSERTEKNRDKGHSLSM